MSHDPGDLEDVRLTKDMITTRQELGHALESLRRQHARETGHGKLSLREIAERTKCGSHTTVSNYLKGKTLPSAEALDRILNLFGAADEQCQVLRTARQALEEEPPPAQSLRPTPRGRWRVLTERPGRHGLRWAVAITLITLVVALAVAAFLFVRRPQKVTFHDLVLASPSPSERWIEDSGCRPQTEFVHRFPGTYRGGVYAQLATTGTDPAKVDVLLTWGPKHWQGVVMTMPGAVHRGRGGTLLGFDKTGTTDDDPPDINPVVTLRTSVPVCAVFGTALTTPPPAPLVYIPTFNWKKTS